MVGVIVLFVSIFEVPDSSFSVGGYKGGGNRMGNYWVVIDSVC